MKKITPIRLTLSLFMLAAIILTAWCGIIFSCEETLEICPACGRIEDGNTDIVGDPRIDGTFAAVQNLRATTDKMSQNTENAINTLLETFEITLSDNETDIDALKKSIIDFISSSEVNMLGISISYGNCFVDRKVADLAQSVCEKRLCNIDRNYSGGICRGYSVGQCKNTELGNCYQPSLDICNQNCIGTCEDISKKNCPGTCYGNCDGTCFDFSQEGLCYGPCNGFCSGICESNLPFSCSGKCDGLCSESGLDAGCDDTDTFAGFCRDSRETIQCRGQYYPQGCGEDCSGCAETAGDCREVAKFLAWSKMACSPSEVRVKVDPSSTAQYPSEILHRTKTLERVLSIIATDHAWLTLVLEGKDLRTMQFLGEEFENSDDSQLDDNSTKYTNYERMEFKEIPPIDLDRSYFPVEALKSRIYWLLRTTLDSTDNFRISAGTFDCLEPALDTAAALLLTMVPVKKDTKHDIASYIADVTCETNDLKLESNTETCLYTLLKKQTELLSLLNTEK